MMNSIVALGYGIIVFAVLIGVGSVVLYSLGGTLADCGIAACGDAAIWNSTSGVCSNATVADCGDPTGTPYTNTNYILGQLGQSGLAGWTPAIIAVSVGMLFLGYFTIKKGSKGRY